MPDNLQIPKHKKDSIEKARKNIGLPPLKKPKKYKDYLEESTKKVIHT